MPGNPADSQPAAEEEVSRPTFFFRRSEGRSRVTPATGQPTSSSAAAGDAEGGEAVKHPTPVKQVAAGYGQVADDFSAGRL